MAERETTAWSVFWGTLETFQASLSKSKALDVNAEPVRSDARILVQDYFRSVRPHLGQLGVPDDLLGALDAPAQELLRLANGRNRRSSYRRTIRDMRTARVPVELERERRLGHETLAVSIGGATSGVEVRVLDTLRGLVTSAALSYEQAIRDLNGPARVSFRGTAVELREAVREVLDHLAPDADVMKTTGFKLEPNATKPTMKQKARFILKARGLGSSALSSPEDAVQRVEDGTASLARSVYTRGNVSTHLATTREEVLTLKLYVDGVLAELLQVHAQPRG